MRKPSFQQGSEESRRNRPAIGSPNRAASARPGRFVPAIADRATITFMGAKALGLAMVASSLFGCGGRYLEVSGDDGASMASGGSSSPPGGGFHSPEEPAGGGTMPPRAGSGGGGPTAPSGGPTPKCGV